MLGVTQEIAVFVTVLLKLWMYKRCYDPETGLYPPRVWRNSMNPGQSAISQSSWGFSTMRCGIDSGDHRFRTWLVGVVVVCRDL